MNNSKNKTTKKEQYNTLLTLINQSEANGLYIEDGNVTFNELRDFINHEIELLDSKTAAAQKRAAKKRADGDALREKVYDVLDTEIFMTIDQIVEKINDPDVTRNMVTSRLAQLIDKDDPENSRVEKEMVTVESPIEGGKSKKIAGYRKM